MTLVTQISFKFSHNEVNRVTLTTMFSVGLSINKADQHHATSLASINIVNGHTKKHVKNLSKYLQQAWR